MLIESLVLGLFFGAGFLIARATATKDPFDDLDEVASLFTDEERASEDRIRLHDASDDLDIIAGSIDRTTGVLWDYEESDTEFKIMARNEDGTSEVLMQFNIDDNSVVPTEDDLNFILDSKNEDVPLLLELVEKLKQRDAMIFDNISVIISTNAALPAVVKDALLEIQEKVRTN